MIETTTKMEGTATVAVRKMHENSVRRLGFLCWLITLIVSGLMFLIALPAVAETCVETSDPAALAQLPPGYTGLGPVVSGSVEYGELPSKVRKFLERNCNGHALVRCDKQFTTGRYNLRLADGIDMTFDAKGTLTNISAPHGYSLSPTLLSAVLPGKLYQLVNHNGFAESVDGVRHSADGFSLSITDPVFSHVNYSSDGILTLIVDK